ncbi:hypothetical protein ACFYO2_33830, partial [Streptomyces sp. NPDC006602]|uniref:hypothetical protein n=1 Tax=Streptomyces sp. NPDC006602 TaxID=3364751 RepID=UPI0036D02509
RPEPEADRKDLSWRVIRHGRMISNFEEGPPPCSCRSHPWPFNELAGPTGRMSPFEACPVPTLFR